MPTYAAIQEAAQRIRDGVIETPCTRTRAFRDLAPGNHYLKLENLQRTGSFKDRGLVFDGRLVRLAITVKDRPGSLAGLTRAVADMGANVLETYHRRAFADISVGDVGIVIQMETRGREHVIEIVHRLEDLGHDVREEQ